MAQVFSGSSGGVGLMFGFSLCCFSCSFGLKVWGLGP